MVEEAYCNNEVSELLKEKGFDWETEHKYWNPHKKIEVKRPTQQMAMRWLRECWKDKEGCIDGFCIEPYAAAYRYGFTISRVPTGSHVCNEDDVYPNEEFESYEEAVEAALKYCLENLL